MHFFFPKQRPEKKQEGLVLEVQFIEQEYFQEISVSFD